MLVVVIGAQTANLVYAASEPSLLGTSGTWIINADQEVVLLRGVNYPGYECTNRPKVHSEANYRLFASMGFNVVRLPISWALLEPRPGVFDASYLTRYVSRDVEWARKYGLYVILDMHQFGWAKRFGGCGMPDWAAQAYPATQAGMRQFVSKFWADNTLQNHLTEIWTKVARTYANNPTIAGYDLLNEPMVYTSVISYLNASHVNEFYLKVIRSIRTVDPNHIIFLEPANMFSNFEAGEKIVWSPHFYPLSFSSTYSSDARRILDEDLMAKYKTFILKSKRPMWIGEFGAFMKDGTYQSWLQDAKGLFDKYQVGWAWWGFNTEYHNIPALLSSPSLSGGNLGSQVLSAPNATSSASSKGSFLFSHTSNGAASFMQQL